MISLLLIAIGGASGALSRYYIDILVNNLFGSTVLGIFLINITGSFLLGIFVSVAASHTTWESNIRLLIAIGFLGSYTTFSTLTVGTMQLVEDGDVTRAVLNIIGSMGVGLVAALLGLIVGRAF